MARLLVYLHDAVRAFGQIRRLQRPCSLEAKINPVWASIVPARDISLAFIPAVMLLAFGYYGLDYCANQLQNPFIAEFGDVQLDGRFANAVCEDIDMLLLCETPGVVEPTREAEPKLVA